jgi:hypothetical protein
MAGLAAYGLTAGGFAASLAAFVTAALVLVLLLFGLALAVARAQEGLLATLHAHTADVKRWGGRILILVGVWFLALAVFADFFARFFPV